jgi:hypothetical protein
LRVAVNVGPVMIDSIGMTGSAIIHTARMIEAPVLKQEMASTGTNLGIIVSPFVYETVIGHAGELAGASQYRAVEVDVKETSTLAWMRLVHMGASPSEIR